MDQKRKAYRDANREKINAQKRAWNHANREKINEARRKYESHPDRKTKRAEQRRLHKVTPEERLRWAANTRKCSQARKAKAVALLGGACVVCGLEDHSAVYDFHHRDPSQKDFAISRGKNWDIIAEELKKCDLVCSNCHRKIHTC